jgi:hypothetical protein
MSLLKIPFIIASAIGVHVAFSSSSPPPSPEEQVEPPMLETIILQFQSLWANDIKKVRGINVLVIHLYGPVDDITDLHMGSIVY